MIESAAIDYSKAPDSGPLNGRWREVPTDSTHYGVDVMLGVEKPPPELLPIHRPRCPDCQARMITFAITEGPEGFEQRTFECARCGHTETRTLASDPFNSEAVGWIKGELRRPQ
jgi:hypothetical protein